MIRWKRASAGPRSDIELIERWFVRYGVPHFDRNFDKHTSVIERALPILILAFPPLVLADAAITRAWLAAAAVVVAIPVTVAVWRNRRRHSPDWSPGPGRLAVLAAIFVLTGPAAALAAGATLPWAGIAAAANAGLAVAVLSWIKLQLGSVIWWVIRRTGREIKHLGSLAVRGVSLLFLITILGFFSSDLWRIANGMGVVRLVFLMIFFMIFGVIFLRVRLKEELYNELKPDGVVRKFGRDEVVKNWKCCAGEGKGLPALVMPPGATTMDAQLGKLQQRNMLFYLMFCQMIQVGLLTFVVWVFYLLLGRFAITNAVMADWFGKPQYSVRLLTVPVPLSLQLIDASTLMAILAGLFFTVLALTDSGYRDEFFKRTMDDLIKAVRVRCAYLLMPADGQALTTQVATGAPAQARGQREPG